MRYHFECLPVHLHLSREDSWGQHEDSLDQSRSLDVLERDFLEDSVVDPEVDVPAPAITSFHPLGQLPSPCSLLHGWRFLSDRSLIHFPHLAGV